MSILALVRHGMTSATGRRLTGWQPGFHLSEEGRNQADLLAERLSRLPVRAIYSSPLERCRETAEPLARAIVRPVEVRPGMGEVRFGEWTGRPLSQLRRTKLWRAVQLVPSNARFPGGESFLEVQERAVQELLGIAALHRGEIAVVVSHADVIKLALAHFAGMHPDSFQRLVVDPCSVSVVALDDGAPRVLKMNDTGGLEHLAPSRRRRQARAGGRGTGQGSVRRSGREVAG